MMPHSADNPPAGAPIAPGGPVTVQLEGRGPDVAALMAGLERLYQVAGPRTTSTANLAGHLATTPDVQVRVEMTVERGHPTPEGSEPTTGQRYDRRYLADALRVLLEPTRNDGTPVPVTIPELVVLRRFADLVAALYAGEQLGQLARTVSERLHRRASGATS